MNQLTKQTNKETKPHRLTTGQNGGEIFSIENPSSQMTVASLHTN